MPWLYYLILLALLFTGLFVNILGLPGLWLMVGSLGLYAWLTHLGVYVGWPVLITVLVLALIAEVVEFMAGSAGAKRAGGNRRAGFGAIIGALIGGLLFSIPVPIVGTVIGVCLGAFAGAAVAQMTVAQDVAHSFRVGAGAAKGRFYGIMSKLAFGIVILIISMISAFPVRSRATTATPGSTTIAPTTPVIPTTTTAPTTIPGS
jgi:uncharacterized protein YqgC (DUF456 family)